VLHCLHLRQLASALFNISELFSAIALALESRAATCTIMPALGAVPLIRDTWAIADLLVCDAVLCHGLSTSSLASMIHLWATIRGISFPVSSALSVTAKDKRLTKAAWIN
jgi:hypothetical protein